MDLIKVSESVFGLSGSILSYDIFVDREFVIMSLVDGGIVIIWCFEEYGLNGILVNISICDN